MSVHEELGYSLPPQGVIETGAKTMPAMRKAVNNHYVQWGIIREMFSTHPKYQGYLVNVLCCPDSMWSRTSMTELVRDLKNGNVPEGWKQYCREVFKWAKDNPKLCQQWHRDFLAAWK